MPLMVSLSRLAPLSFFVLAACTTGPVDPPTADAAPRLAPSLVPPLARSLPSRALDAAAPVTRIAFGSCNQQYRRQDFWGAIAATEPDAFVYLGDNVYGDVRSDDPSMPELRGAYYQLAASDDFAAFREAVPVIPLWDDHDYGANDQGAGFALKATAEAIFEDAWALAPDDPRRARPGVYHEMVLGPDGQRVQLILLDTRFFRSDLAETDERGAPGRERYVPTDDPGQTMLGAAQEAWLAEALGVPADLRVVVSSVQVIAEGHGWEAWATLPAARARLLETLKAASGRTVIVSGDRHAGGLYALGGLLEMTASSLNAPASGWGPEAYAEAGPHRMGPMVRDANFGTLEIDWAAGTGRFVLRDMAGGVFQETAFGLTE